MHFIGHLILWLLVDGGKRGLICASAIVLTFCSLLATQLTVNAIYEDGGFYTANGWPKSMALGIPGIVFLIGGLMLQQPKRTVKGVDFETGNEIVEVRIPENRGAFIFLAVWGALMLVGSIAFLATQGWRSQVKRAHNTGNVGGKAIVSFPVAVNHANQGVGLTVDFAAQGPVHVYLVVDNQSKAVVKQLRKGQPVEGQILAEAKLKEPKSTAILRATMPPDSAINIVIQNKTDEPLKVFWDAYQ